MATLFYKTKKDSSTGKKMQELIDRGNEIEKQINAYVSELGAGLKYVMKGDALFGTGIRAVNFSEEPDSKIWKKFPKFEGYYSPRLSNQKGKEISSKLHSFEVIQRGDVNKIIGYQSFLSHCGIGLKNENYFGFETDSEWKLEMPEDCEEITFTEYGKLFNKK